MANEFFNTQDSNSAIMNFAFVIMVIIVFFVLLQFSIQFLGTIFSDKNGNPTLIKGMVEGKTMIEVEQDPNESGSITVIRSSNENDGVEFTYSLWLFIDDLEYNKGQFRHIFHKGDDIINYNDDTIGAGLSYPNNAPGLYLAPYKNDLVVAINTFQNVVEKVIIQNITLNKWINVIIRCENKTLDVYINGSIARRHVLSGLPRQNYGNVYACMNGGFSGNLSTLKYFNHAIGTREIENILFWGPDTTISDDSDLKNKNTRYLSFKWYTSGQIDNSNNVVI
uniref:LamG-like jellyroll fold domain-containing protein n=1 Tax=viral metagenome TaxID=1070528 RepID=A0A6C0AVE2_9ZZZZ|tara:strand:+ start:9849 stop:10688 length:840 start_codon:yes stop_codon:yes gene_type:complete